MHETDTATIAVIAGCIVVWGLVSARLERLNITAPIAFVVLGLAVTHQPLALIHISLHSWTVREIAELALAVVLFADAARVNPRAARADAGLPGRLLGIGLPLTIGLGVVAAMLASGGDWWIAAVIGAIVAPTDAALGAQILEDKRVPGRVRRVLNIESGLNDGIATPFVNLFLAGAVAQEVEHSAGPVSALAKILIGVAIGAGIGLAGAALLRYTTARGWSGDVSRPIALLALAFLAYAVALEGGGNGFVAAFAGGLAFGALAHGTPAASLTFTDDAGELLSLLVWFLFGATMIVPALSHFAWPDAIFAVLALTVVRMVPVAVALAGTGLDRATVAFIGWFGPRGLASVVFALIAADTLDRPAAQRVLAAVVLTVLASVVAHGVTASPLAARYGAHLSALRGAPGAPGGLGPEHTAAPELRARSLGVNRRRDPG